MMMNVKALIGGLVHIIYEETPYPHVARLFHQRPDDINSCIHQLRNFIYGHDFPEISLNVE